MYTESKRVTAKQWGQDWEERLASCLPARTALEQEFSGLVMRRFRILASETRGMSMARLAELIAWQRDQRKSGHLFTISGNLKHLSEKVLAFKRATTVDSQLTGLDDFGASKGGARKVGPEVGPVGSKTTGTPVLNLPGPISQEYQDDQVDGNVLLPVGEDEEGEDGSPGRDLHPEAIRNSESPSGSRHRRSQATETDISFACNSNTAKHSTWTTGRRHKPCPA